MNRFSSILRRRGKALSALALTLVMTTSLGCSSALSDKNTPPDKETAEALESGVTFEDVTGKVNLDSVALQNLSPQAIKGVADTKANSFGEETIIISLKGESLSDGKPEDMTVGEYLKTGAGRLHADAIEAEHKALFKELASLKIAYKVKYEYSAVLNAVAIEVNPSYAAAIKAIDGVTSVVGSTTYNAPETQASLVYNGSIDEIYTTGIYDASEFTSQGYTGKNVSVAILDTGLDYTHEAFDMEISDGDAAFTYADIDAKLSAEGTSFNAYKNLAAQGKTLRTNDVYLSSKVPFAFDYADRDTDVYPSYSQHGTHVAGIVAGKADSYTDKNGHVVMKEEDGVEVPVPFSGVAPGAQLVICKVFTDNTEDASRIGGAVTEDLVAALEDCVLLGVDVINMSLGTSCGFSEVEIDGDTEGELLKKCYESVDKAGINLLAAASNDFSAGYGGNFGTNLATNPDAGTVGSPSTYTTALSVASINGQLSPYVLANKTETSEGNIIFFDNSSDANSVSYDFVKQMLGDKTSDTFRYVLVPGYGRTNDYSTAVQGMINTYKDAGEKVIVVVKRGSTTFQQKVEIAMERGADAIIVYNNVTGKVRMTLGEIEDPIPAISVSMEAGAELERGPKQNGVTVGTITVDKTLSAGPFMNDYSSWGVTPDLKLKPEVTIYGGEIISTVAGGYQEMSGTSMATPNMAGLVAVAIDYLHDHEAEYSNLSALSDADKRSGYTEFVDQLAMSTGVIVYDDSGLPVSPRKQGAGLVSLVNMLASKVYLSNSKADKNRPKVELGDDKERTGKYVLEFELNNISGVQKTYELGSLFMTETLSPDGLTVAEKAYLLDGNAEYEIGGKTYKNGDKVTFAGGATAIKATLTLSDDEKAYIDRSFKNGMFIEGYIRFIADKDGADCDMSIPFVGYYGDWENPDMPLLDMDAYTAAEYERDNQYNDDTRPKPSVWATQAYGRYYGGTYAIPLGSYTYLQDENAEQIYVEKDHVAISCYNDFDFDNPGLDYCAAYAIRGLYAGLLRNAELCVYTVTDESTGEVILEKKDYRITKAHTAGGSTVPAFVEMDLSPSELGLASNGKYRIDFQFYFRADNLVEAADSKFSMTFYVDYEAPILQDAKVRYYNYKDGDVDKQRVYLDLYVYDNHYAQSVLLCYADTDDVTDSTQLKLATEYVTPVYNAVKNGTTLVTIEVTDFIDEYSGKLYAQFDDYALNHTVYSLNIPNANVSLAPDNYSLAEGEENITLKVGGAHTVALENIGEADLANFVWTSSAQRFVKVENGVIVGVAPGTATVTVSNKSKDSDDKDKAVEYTIKVTVTDDRFTGTSLKQISFGTILADDRPVKASGYVEVNPGQKLTLKIETEPWYFDMEAAGLVVRYTTTNESRASVDEYGNVTIGDYEWYDEAGVDANGKAYKRGDVKYDPTGAALITATVYRKVTDPVTGEEKEEWTSTYTSVNFVVKDSFRVTNMSLSSYHGTAKEVWIPNDRNIMQIGTQAFDDCTTVEVVHVPKTVATINERAFEGCINLREVIFEDSDSSDDIHDSALNMIYRWAFADLPKLEVVDFTNCRSVTIARQSFANCASLKEVKGADNITTAGNFAFANCTSLEYIDISNLHSCGAGAFYGCTRLKRITTGKFTEIGDTAFYGCTSLRETGADKTSAADESFTLHGAKIGEAAFVNCAISDVTFTNPRTVIGDMAFYGSFFLDSVNFAAGSGVISIGDDAFSKCDGITSITVPNEGAEIGKNDCEINGSANFKPQNFVDAQGNVYTPDKKTLLSVSATATTVDLTGVEVIASQAFVNARNITSIVLPASVKAIDEGAFARSSLVSCDLSATSIKAIPANAFAGSEKLANVILPDGLAEIGENAFGVAKEGNTLYACKALKSIDLKNVKTIGAHAFENSALESIALPAGVTEIPTYAFKGTAIRTVNFEHITTIGSYAFAYSALSAVDLASVKEIGEGAFYATDISTVTVPATVEKMGEGVFARNPSLTAILVAEGNKNFFIEDGALYRTISEGNFELLAYPGARVAANGRFVVKDGTSSIGSSAFEGIAPRALSQVELAYTVKVIGDAAFFESGVTTYYFNSIVAPTLLTQVDENVTNELVRDNMLSYRGMFYNNFEEYLYRHVGDVYGDYTVTGSNLTIYAPENGVNYDNYIYSHYFGRKVSLGILIDDETRAVKTGLENLADKIDVVNSWQADSFTVTPENKAAVEALVGEVSSLHASYLAITDKDQLKFIDDALLKNLETIEDELRPVKDKFGIAAKIAKVEYVTGSVKTAYKVGETLDMSGLKVLITYDDYSTDERTLSAGDYTYGMFSTKPDTPLTEFDNTVEIVYSGYTVYVNITVTAEGGDTPDPTPKPEDPKDENSNLGLIIGLSVGGGVLALAAAGVAVYFLVFKKKGVKAQPEQPAEKPAEQPAEDKQTKEEDGNENP